MADGFQYDVFLSHSSKDKPVVRELAERLRKDGLKVWFDEWVLKAGDSIPAKIEEGLEHSRVLVLCMSANAFGSDWAQLESGTFRFRDPLNKERRFIPLRLDNAPIKGSLAQFLYFKWLPANRKKDYPKLLETFRPTAVAKVTTELLRFPLSEGKIYLSTHSPLVAYAFNSTRTLVVTGGRHAQLRLWDVSTGKCLVASNLKPRAIECVAWSADETHLFSGSNDRLVRLWNVQSLRCKRTYVGHRGTVQTIACCSDSTRILSGSADRTLRLWNTATGECIRIYRGHVNAVSCVAWSRDQLQALSGSDDGTMKLWNLQVEDNACLQTLTGHTDAVRCVSWSPDQRFAISGSDDRTLRLWDLTSGRCLTIFEGHTGPIRSVAWSAHEPIVLSASWDRTIRAWNLDSGTCLGISEEDSASIYCVAWSHDKVSALSGNATGGLRRWDVSTLALGKSSDGIIKPSQSQREITSRIPNQTQYTNAKVLLVGESGTGKTGLSMRLASKGWRPSDSTVGAWATQWKLPVESSGGIEREIWLWDFGGQADQRLIHQLYMDETALAVLVFDGQKDDLFETLGQWDRDLTRASQKTFTKLLVAGRVDAGGLRASRTQLETFKKERGYLDFLETSAKTGLCCDELKQAILKGIRWEDIPWRSSPVLFKRLKEEIIKLKDAGRVLMRFNELREALQLRLSGELTRFTDDEMKAVVGLLSGPGVVWELKFGSWVLLQPGRINAYAQAVIQTMRADEHERGCLAEERVLGGDLTYHRPEERLPADEERFVLLAMHKILVERGLCLREHTDTGTMLIFPSYYRRERPELVGHPAALVSYRFNGFLDEIYATLVVRLHHTKPFTQDQLWRYAADFKTLTGKQLGVKLERRAEGAGELVVYADPKIADEEKIIFSRYVHEHILQKSGDMVRLRHYCCPHCDTPVGNREVAMERLNAWLANQPAEAGLAGKIKATKKKPKAPTIICSKCEKRVPLWDELEQYFASDEVKERVRQLQAESDLVLDSESKDRALVGDVISTVALAGQIIEEYSAKRYGLDMEIEFKNDDGKPTAKKLYLQLKSGDSHLRKRQSDGAEIFQIHHEDHAKYWMEQAYPVFLVIGNSEGEVRWMEIRDYLKRKSNNGKKTVKQIVFTGERFDVMSVRRWREKVLGV
jgi:small GTP-binding protein